MSAKEGDGSVHAAIQTLVRHLLLKRMKVKNKDVILKNLFNSRKKHEDVEDGRTFVPFVKTKINEVCSVLIVINCLPFFPRNQKIALDRDK